MVGEEGRADGRRVRPWGDCAIAARGIDAPGSTAELTRL